MELYGVMHYFDCQGAMMIYNGRIMPDAVKVAIKLGIQLIYLDQHLLDCPFPENETEAASTFEIIWIPETHQNCDKSILFSSSSSISIGHPTK